MIGLEYVLQKLGISNIDLAREFNIDRSNVTLWLSGKRNIPKKYLTILSEKASIPVELLEEELTSKNQFSIDLKFIANHLKSEKYLEKAINNDEEAKKYVISKYNNLILKNSQIKFDDAIEKIRKSVDENDENIGNLIFDLNLYTTIINSLSDILNSNKFEFKNIIKFDLLKFMVAIKILYGLDLNEEDISLNLNEDEFVKRIIEFMRNEYQEKGIKIINKN